VIVIFLLFVNSVGLLFMYIDKEKAKKGKWRIPEKRLWMVAFIGGAVGTYIGMYMFRHKTKHAMFKYGMPTIILLQVSIYLYLK
jgi:uncharacterized membrane protein YsdA (DUF1294 family)